MRILNSSANFVKLAATVAMIAALWTISIFIRERFLIGGVVNSVKAQGCCTDQPAKLRRMIGSYYTTENDFESTLILNNKGPNQIMVTPILHGKNGETFKADPVAVGGQSSAEVNLNVLAGIAGSEFRSGSFEFAYEGRLLEMGGGLRIVKAHKSLIFDEQMLEPGMKFGGPKLEAVYALPFRGSSVEVILTNTTANSISVNGKAVFLQGEDTPIEEKLEAYQSKVIALPQELTKQVQAGAVSLSHDGEKGALLAVIHVQDDERGYSETVNFSNPGGKTNEKHGAGLRLGYVDGEWLKPVIVARNLGDSPTIVRSSIHYSRKDGRTGTIALPHAFLDPGEVQLIRALNPRLRNNDFDTAGLEVKYTGEPGSVIVSASTVSQRGNHVFALPMKDPQGGLSSTGGYPWFIGDTSSTVVFIKNVTDEPQDFIMNITHADGNWRLKPRALAPQQTIAVDLKKIRDSQEPGVDGDLMPAEVRSGHIAWGIRGGKNKVLIGRAQTVDFEHGMASTYECQCPCNPNWAGGSRIRPVSFQQSDPLIAGETETVAIEATYFLCYQGQETNEAEWYPVLPQNIQSLTSLNPFVIDFNGYDQIGIFDEGSAPLKASFPIDSWQYICAPQGDTDCQCNNIGYTVNAINTFQAVKADIGFGSDGGPSVTQGIRDIITGERVSLWLKPNNATNISWTITGTPHLKEYRIGPGSSTGEVVPIGPFNERNMVVHWVGNSSNPMGEQRQASVSFRIGSRTRTRSAVFNLMTPVPSIITTNSGTIGAGPIPEEPGFAAWLYYGRSAAGVGVSFTSSALAFPGEVQWVQIVNSDRRLTVAGLGNYKALSVGLDGEYPYPQVNPSRVVDSPKQPILINYSSIIVHDRFSMYFMFKSSIPDSIWVPLKVGEWGWDAAATNSPASGPALVPGSVNKVGPSIVTTTDHPTWSAVVTGPVFLPVP